MSDYDSLTLREVMLVMQGYQDRMLHDYRNTRLLMFMMLRLWGDPKKLPDTPEDMWRLPGEDVNGMTTADIDAIFAKLRQNQSSG